MLFRKLSSFTISKKRFFFKLYSLFVVKLFCFDDRFRPPPLLIDTWRENTINLIPLLVLVEYKSSQPHNGHKVEYLNK